MTTTPPPRVSFRRLTTAQALVEFLTAQWSERDGIKQRLVPGCFAIFGHGNVAGIGQALQQAGDARIRCYQGRNEQAMVHAAAGFARASRRLATLACTTSVGPGATNLVTGAAGATVNRLPVLLLPGDTFATRMADPVLQQLEDWTSPATTVNDCLRPVSRFWDRITRPEQLAPSLLEALRVLTDPVATGAVTIAMPEDVQVEAHDFPEELFARRVWPIVRSVPVRAQLTAAAEAIRGARRPLLVAGGGVCYSEAEEALRKLVDQIGMPVAETQAGKGSLPHNHPLGLGGLGVTGTRAANAIAANTDLVIGVGTRWSDFTTASRSLFRAPDVRFVNVNVSPGDAAKLGALPVVGDARATLECLTAALGDHQVASEHVSDARTRAASWRMETDRICAAASSAAPSQAAIVRAVNEATGPGTTLVAAAGSLPGDLHKLWKATTPDEYHVEYGYSCMGYEIAGALGVKLARPDREVVALVGDGSWLMMSSELLTAVQESAKMIVVLVDNHGHGSIRALSHKVGSAGFGTEYRYRSESGSLDGSPLSVDFEANAASLGARAVRVATTCELTAALAEARAGRDTTVICVEADPDVGVPSFGWWDVPVAEVSANEDVTRARATYESERPPSRLRLR